MLACISGSQRVLRTTWVLINEDFGGRRFLFFFLLRAMCFFNSSWAKNWKCLEGRGRLRWGRDEWGRWRRRRRSRNSVWGPAELPSFSPLLSQVKARAQLRLAGLFPSAYWCGQALVDVPFFWALLCIMFGTILLFSHSCPLHASTILPMVSSCWVGTHKSPSLLSPRACPGGTWAPRGILYFNQNGLL